MPSAAAQADNYCVKNTFLSVPPEFPKSTFFRMTSCPGSYSNEPTVDSLPILTMESAGIPGIDAPELDDACSVASDMSLPSSSTEKWSRMQTGDACWEQAEVQAKMLPIPEVNSKYNSNTSKFSSNASHSTASQGSSSEGASSKSKELVNLVDALKETTGAATDVKTTTHDSHAMRQALFGGYSAPVDDSKFAPPVMEPALFPVTPCTGNLGEFDGKSTVMMRNLPNQYTRALLLEELGRTGFHGTYDFLYVPMDANKQANKGYAFINFATPGYAKSFKMTYEDCTMPLFNSSKYISVTPASLQGFEANYSHYATARCNKGDPGSRPLFLREQEPVKEWTSRRTNNLLPNRRKETTNLSGSGMLDTGRAQVASGKIVPEARARDQTDVAEAPRTRRVCKFCPECGTGDQAGHKFCSECGHPLPQM